MKEMLAEYEQNIVTIKSILTKLKAKPESEFRDLRIIQYETMLYDVQGKAAEIRKYMEGGKKTE